MDPHQRANDIDYLSCIVARPKLTHQTATCEQLRPGGAVFARSVRGCVVTPAVLGG